MTSRWMIVIAALLPLACGGANLEIETGDIEEDVETSSREIDLPRGDNLATSCEADGPTRDLCKAERACLDGDGESCASAAEMWATEGVKGPCASWEYIFYRRGCALGDEPSCEHLGHAVPESGYNEVPPPEDEIDVEETEPEPEPEPEPVPELIERRATAVFLDDGEIGSQGLPAVSKDGKTMAHLVVNGDEQTLLIINTGSDEITYEKVLDKDTVEDAEEQLADTKWIELITEEQTADAVRDCKHVEEIDDGEVCVQKMTVGKLDIRYAEPFLTTDEKEVRKRRWSQKGCAAYIKTAATGPKGGLLLLEIRYDGKGCKKNEPQVHVVKTR